MKLYKFILIGLSILISSCSHAEQKEIKSSELIKDLKKGKSIEIANKIILDDIDFTSIENYQMLNAGHIQNVVEGNIFFYNCIFMGDVKATGTKDTYGIQTKFNNNLVFQNCDFRGEVDFENAIVMGQFNFNQAKFRKKVSFNNMMVWSKDSYFSEIEAEGPITMIYTSFFGNLQMKNCKFHDDLCMQNATINDKFMASSMVCSKSAEFDMATFRGRVNFNYSNFSKSVSFIQARFHDDADFIETIFAEPANFESTYFYGTLNLDDVEYPCARKSEEIIKVNK